MKVAIVHELLHKLGGAERVLKVLTDMFPAAPIYTLVYDENKVGAIFPKEKVIPSRLQKYFQILKQPQLLLPKMAFAIEMFDFSGYDLVISSSSAFAHGIITPLKTKHLCYCHSPMRYAWDYTHQYREEKSRGFLKPIKNFLISRTLGGIRLWDKVAADRPDPYLANSETVRHRLKKYYQVEAQVIYPPVAVDRFTPTPNKQDYFLIVSALTSFKRIDLAIQAFNSLGKPLYIIGHGADGKYLKRLAKPHIKFLGRQNDEVVKKYLENARALIFPGEDDFGITPVEALACGTPVLAYAKGGALETIVPGKTGEFFYEPTAAALTAGLNKLLQNYPHYQISFMRERAETFRTENFKREVANAISKLLA